MTRPIFSQYAQSTPNCSVSSVISKSDLCMSSSLHCCWNYRFILDLVITGPELKVSHLSCQIIRTIRCLMQIFWHDMKSLRSISINIINIAAFSYWHDDVIKWKHFPRYWPLVWGIHRSPVNSPYKGQWRGALMFSLICVWINGWVNDRKAGDFRRYRAHYDVIVMGGLG